MAPSAAPLLLLALVLPLAGGLRTPAPDREAELERALEDLGAEDADARRLAERWLAAHVLPEDFATVAEAAVEADLEGVTRLTRAIGSDDRHVGLAVLFTGELEPALRTIGRNALGEMIARWAPSLDEPPQVQGALLTRLARLRDRYRPMLLEVDADWPIPRLVDAIARLGEVPLPVVLDPRLDEPPEVFVESGRVVARGLWDELLVELERSAGLALEGHGLGELEEDRVVGFVRLCPSRDAARRTGTELLLSWIRDAAHTEDVRERAAAARALAASGWPAGIRWLARRWTRTGDPALLQGCAVAAARGLLPAELATPEALRALLALADAELPLARPVARRTGHLALHAAAAFPALGRGGADLAGEVLAGWEERGPAERWNRLVVLEGMAPARGPAAELLRAELQRTDAAPELRRQALRALDAIAPESGVPAGFSGLDLLEESDTSRVLRDVAQRLARLGAALPDPAAVAGFPYRALACVEWALRVGEPGRAAAYAAHADLGGEGRRDENRMEYAARLVGDAARQGLAVDAFLAAAGETLPEPTLEQLACLAGRLPETEHERVAAGWARQDPRALGLLVDGPAGEAARRRLLELVDIALEGGPLPGRTEDLAAGLERALQTWLLARRDARAEAFLSELRTRARAAVADGRPGPLAALLAGRPGWPSPPHQAVRILSELDRRFPADALGGGR